MPRTKRCAMRGRAREQYEEKRKRKQMDQETKKEAEEEEMNNQQLEENSTTESSKKKRKTNQTATNSELKTEDDSEVLRVGEKAPDFEAPDQNNNRIKLSDIKKMVVLFFYPRDNTPDKDMNIVRIYASVKPEQHAKQVLQDLSEEEQSKE
ncbi:hypothetical protein FDP41_006313 [Naegleria fowleri]|uniref:Alkyl hydroperoxide reductase subunit C/ Thiol specific antioxidant domain-containing protein n=1 Tax=Naegleria fowleri TaxID=5763 RepID=A0A6A5BPI9_NAEFO|nr:uncharacterized protein FDP41_006313 [Naegleria fowleri]KAF0974839.1 hypothetical protein FDP41_006313 [Naegleria fowleri]